MITAVFTKDTEGCIHSFTISGHAGFADAGQDIICAAVSALSINTVNAIEKLTKTPIQYKVGADGFLVCTVQDPHQKDAQLLLQALILGLRDIQRSYGKGFLRIRQKAVSSTIEI